MNLQDVRRLSVTTALFALFALGWLVWLALHRDGVVDSPVAQDALSAFDLENWLWISYALLFLLFVLLASVVFLLNQAPPGYARGFLRQVQCQDCQAVFVIHDNGNRPLSHQCPNCKALGIYDGTAPPVGTPPVPRPPKAIIDLELACQSCQRRFHVTDTGARPLRVKCPACGARGKVT